VKEATEKNVMNVYLLWCDFRGLISRLDDLFAQSPSRSHVEGTCPWPRKTACRLYLGPPKKTKGDENNTIIEVLMMTEQCLGQRLENAFSRPSKPQHCAAVLSRGFAARNKSPEVSCLSALYLCGKCGVFGGLTHSYSGYLRLNTGG